MRADGDAAIYVGTVAHKRLRPRRHALRYRVFSALLDVDRLADTARRTLLFSYNRFNLFAIHDADHGLKDGRPVAAAIRELLAGAGLGDCGARILILAYPRFLGYAFNPITCYFCHRADGALGATVYQVDNTFGQRRHYVLAADADGGIVHQRCAKRLYVSPFNEAAGDYGFHLRPPGETLVLGVNLRDREGPLLIAHFTGARRPFGDRQLVLRALTMPFMTVKIVAAIHLEAARLWLKGLSVRPRPGHPPVAVSRSRDAVPAPIGD